MPFSYHSKGGAPNWPNLSVRALNIDVNGRLGEREGERLKNSQFQMTKVQGMTQKPIFKKFAVRILGGMPWTLD
jgi:hypothetical protein